MFSFNISLLPRYIIGWGTITLLFACGENSVASDSYADSELLPNPFVVYIDAYGGIANITFSGARAVNLPTINVFTGSPGGYVACYSKDVKGSVYSVGGGIYVMGQIRVPGHYVGRNFVAQVSWTLTSAATLSASCQANLAQCQSASGGCWPGGDTGGWFGL